MKKFCSKCKEEKDLEEFKGKVGGKYGKDSMCKPCKKAYADEYYLANKSRLNAKSREYHRKNIEKVRDSKLKYREKNKVAIANKCKKNYLKNKDKIISRVRDYAKVNKDKIAERGRKYRASHQEEIKLYRAENKMSAAAQGVVYREKNKVKLRADIRKWREENKDKVLTYSKEYGKKNRAEISKRQKIYNNKTDLNYTTFLYLLTVDLDVALDGDYNILVGCYNCGSYHKPKLQSLIEHRNAKGEKANLYCSTTCKKSCSVFGRRKWPKDFKPNPRELQGWWRDLILDQDNYECQKCGSKENLHAHHIEPLVKTYDSWTKDNGIAFCAKCHFGYAHKLDGCTMSELRAAC